MVIFTYTKALSIDTEVLQIPKSKQSQGRSRHRELIQPEIRGHIHWIHGHSGIRLWRSASNVLDSGFLLQPMGSYTGTCQVFEEWKTLSIDYFLSDAVRVGTTGNSSVFISGAVTKPDCCKGLGNICSSLSASRLGLRGLQEAEQHASGDGATRERSWFKSREQVSIRRGKNDKVGFFSFSGPFWTWTLHNNRGSWVV